MAEQSDDVLYDDTKAKRDATTFLLASVGTRVIALIIDNVILGVISGILGGISGRNDVGFIVYFIIQTAYQWYFLVNRDGQTPGKSLMHIRVVKVDGSPITASDAVVRSIGYAINSIPFLFGLGWWWALFDNHYQGWHDKLANTYVIKA
jgi:uncharacterized RDD family membrane protein YckC